MAKSVCSALKKEVLNDAGSVTFPCPKCATPIVRTKQARQIVAKYTCSKCGFTGPN